jgi:hypothetical protein
MSHVVMQASEWDSVDAAIRCEKELRALFDTYVRFEREDSSPWAQDRVAPPLAAFGRAHGVAWPLEKDSRFLLKGGIEDSAEILRVDRMVFFWGGGFDLGGEALRNVLRSMGAVRVAEGCTLFVRSDDPDERVKQLAAFLDDEDFEEQYEVDDGVAPADHALHTVTFVSKARRRRIVFDDSGVQDWAFVAILPQLDGENPSLAP